MSREKPAFEVVWQDRITDLENRAMDFIGPVLDAVFVVVITAAVIMFLI